MLLKKGPVIGITADPGPDPSGERASLKEEYALAVLSAGGMPVAVPVFPMEDPQRVLEYLDGIIVPGGDDIEPYYYGEKQRVPMKLVPSRRTDFEISLIRAAISQNVPILGICYGMQLINVALGGSLYQDLETDLNEKIPVIKKRRATVAHRRGLHEIIISGTGPLPAGRHMVNSSHHQGVSRLANVLIPAAHSEEGLVEAFYLNERTFSFLAGVQWHPERMAGDPVARNIFSSFIRAAQKAGRK